MTNVLLACPHNRLESGTVRAAFTLSYAGALDHFFTRRNPDPVPGLNIVAAYQRIRAVFLADPTYTHLFIVENDILPPPDALDKLLACDADIAYGVYCFRRGMPVVNVMRRDTTDPLTQDAAVWGRAFAAGAIVPCKGLGFGCTLIRRAVLERFEMRTAGGGGDADTWLARDAAAAGLTLKAHLGVVCGHIRPDGVTLWPTGQRPFYREEGPGVPQIAPVRARVSFAHFDRHGFPTTLEAGETGVIEAELAASMAGRGQVEYVGKTLEIPYAAFGQVIVTRDGEQVKAYWQGPARLLLTTGFLKAADPAYVRWVGDALKICQYDLRVIGRDAHGNLIAERVQ